MVKLINADTKTVMWVHESRLKEYLAMGHKIAPWPDMPKKKAPTKKTKAKQGE